MNDITISIFEQGLIYGIMALGTYISYKILNFPDLSADGTFPLGAALTASLIMRGTNPYLCIVLSALFGALAGAVTGFLNVKFKIKDLLSGILTMTALYSVNYRIAGAPNLFIMGKTTVFSATQNIPSHMLPFRYLIIILAVALIAKVLLDLYLSTKSGFLIRCVGDNEGLVVTLAQNPGRIKIIGLAISNSLIAVSGSLACQRSMQFDITCGTGIMVMGLAAVIIGTTVFKKIKFMRLTTAVFLGMIIYKTCITAAISTGLASSDTNLIITVLFVAALLINNITKKIKKEGNIDA